MSYFTDHVDALSLIVKHREEDVGIRECQIGAYWAVKGHFTAQDKPALVSLPTGAGKTALMMLLAFGLHAERVLIITPTDVLRKQTAEKFQELDGLKSSEVVPDDIESPRVHKQKSRITSRAQWMSLSEYDVVVSLPHVISTGFHQDIVEPPEDLFDVVLYDEAHHMRAPSWHKLLSDYQRAKQVLLTATPFRRDKRRLPGRLVYFYPLSKAMTTGLYHPVKYEPVPSTSPATRNTELRNRAVQVLKREREVYADAKVLIRTDNIREANSLEPLYRAENIKVETIHSQRTPKQNDDSLRRLEHGEIDGLIGVGMLSEGIDIPSLKIAVFHSPPKSFPFTVQLIGRVARPIGTNSASAYVIADPNQLREKGVEEEVRRLYRNDSGWRELIPELVEQVAGSVLRDIRHGASDLLLGINVDDLRPYYSTRLYRVHEADLKLNADIDLGEDIGIYPLPSEEDVALLGLITEVQKTPAWAMRSGIETSQFDLHLYFYHSASKTLFESTTSDLLASDIRSQIEQGKGERLGGDELVRAMQSPEGLDYIAAGLANAVGPTSAIPSYKMFLGRSVQGAINPSDALVFVRGHVFAKMGEEETRGISDGQGRVWASKRGSISDFIGWCTAVGDDLVKNKNAIAPTDFAFFSLPDRLLILNLSF